MASTGNRGLTEARAPVRAERPRDDRPNGGSHGHDDFPGKAGRVSDETRRLLPVLLPVALAGAAVAAAAVVSSITSPLTLAAVGGVAALLAAALFSEAFPVPVENLPGGRLSLAAVFVLSAAMLYGWTAAVAVAVLTRVTLELVQRRPVVKLVYNGAVYALAAAAAGVAVAFVGSADSFVGLAFQVLVGATAFYVVDIPLVAAILARWSREPFLPILRASVVWTAATFAIMASVSLALVVLWHESIAFALALAGPLVAVAMHQRSTHEALRAMRLALTDPLTGLGNHRHFQEQLQIRLEESSTAGAPVSICLFDIDNFKQINDRYGHPAGDRVLAQVAARLRQYGEAFRLGGDEFALILSGQSADAAAASAAEIVRTFGQTSLDPGGPITLSAGIATYPDLSDDRNALVRVADIALYWAKGEGKNRVSIYRPDMPAVTQLRRLTRAPDRAARLQAAGALAYAIDARDEFEAGHSARVGDLAADVAARLGLTAEEVELIRLAGRLHDVGKLAVPEEILRKSGKLTASERSLFENHPRVGHRMLVPLDIEPVPTWVLHHHERWDGAGFPTRLSGERIPLGSRIIFAVEAWDAMTHHRPYRPARPIPEAREELLTNAGSQFDPAVVSALLEELDSARARPQLSAVGG